MDIYCLMTSGLPLNDQLSNLLVSMATDMLRKNKSKRKIKRDTIEGEIRTKQKRAQIGGISGCVFEATIEVATGRTEVKFIVRDIPDYIFDPDDVIWCNANKSRDAKYN